ncbi:MAG: hypothetical protein P0116_09620 [Candidatus Nitrosocosmicus sp.]|nr:hypothetical protein [Candidatus Nitrosocosmicus sp.]
MHKLSVTIPPSGDGVNKTQTFDDGNNNAIEGSHRSLSPSNEKAIQFEDTPTKTIAQSDNLQNPSTQKPSESIASSTTHTIKTIRRKEKA